MKPEDLVVGERYFDIKKEHSVLIYKYLTDDLGRVWYYFDYEIRPSGSDKLQYVRGCRYLSADVEDLIFKYKGEKTMSVRKPEEICLILSNAKVLNLISSLGYDLTDYELHEDMYSKNGFAFELKLKEHN